ncbi:MAG TPA: hypothetical protein VGR19_02470 [Allosphingosinicella sp.]|nr:hypothetical protein [Allosphingosinicella sp.]
MSFEGTIAAAPGQAEASSGAFRSSTPRHLTPAWLLSTLLVLAAILQQCVIGLDADVSWLLTVGERVLDGQRLYVDIFEVNPPASVLIYLPGIAAARLLGVSAELGTAALIFILAGVSIWGSARLLLHAGILQRGRHAPILCCAAFAFVLLPGACFAQREHVALLTLLPFMAVLGVRMKGRSVALAAGFLAGLGAGVTMAIKPHFVLAVAPMVLFAMWRRRSISVALGPEVGAAAAVVLSYALLVVAIYPIYLTDALPLLNAVYIPARSGYAEMLLSPHRILFLAAFVLTAVVGQERLVRSFAILPFLAAAGFAAALLMQGKGYLNHAYPAVALAVLALAIILMERQADRGRRRAGGLALVLLAGLSVYVFLAVTSYAELARTVERVAPPSPRIIVAGSNLSVGHPITRWLEGRWVGRRASLWATGTGVRLLSEPMDAARRALIEAYVEEDRRIFVEDIARGRPDVVLVPGVHGMQWIASHPEVAGAMKSYRTAGSAQDVFILVRRPGL